MGKYFDNTKLPNVQQEQPMKLKAQTTGIYTMLQNKCRER